MKPGIPPHPLVKKVFRLAELAGIGPVHLARRAGVNHKNHWDWRKGKMPRLDLFCYTAEALGYEVVIRKKKK